MKIGVIFYLFILTDIRQRNRLRNPADMSVQTSQDATQLVGDVWDDEAMALALSDPDEKATELDRLKD